MTRTPAVAEPDAPPHPAQLATGGVIPLPSDRARAAGISQATAVEQARAVAEVQAAVMVAQAVPRDVARAEAEMHDTCSRLALAERAFYSVQNRGNGPSVHLARELARIWGNVDYGVKELRRDDAAGISEVLAYAWDQQTNVRSTRTFIVPHQRMASGKRKDLVDLGDIYLNNQNVGARAVRECIFTVLPAWLTEEAQTRCRETIKGGNGKPLEERAANAIAAFARYNVDEARLAAKVGRPVAKWTADDIANLVVIFGSIDREGVAVDELLPPTTTGVTAAEIAGQQ